MIVQTESGAMGFMPFYYQRFAWSTRGWPADAALAYLYLLCEQYSNGGLNSDPQVLEEIAPGTVAHWDRIKRKFLLGPDGLLRNPRCEEIRAKSLAAGERKRESARNAAAMRWHTDGNATAMRPHSDRNATAMRNDANENESDNESESEIGTESESKVRDTLTADGGEPVSVQAETKQRRKPLGTDADFELWWKVYPRKVGKVAARKAWLKALPAVKQYAQVIDEAVAEVMQEAVAAYVAEPETKKLEPQYVPHPATWLNEGRYIDILERLDAR